MNIVRSLWHFILLLRPLSGQEKRNLERVSCHLKKEARDKVRTFVKQFRINIVPKKIPYSKAITQESEHASIAVKDRRIGQEVERLNDAIERSVEESIIHDFKEEVWQRMQNLFAAHIVGFDEVKKGVILQLFSRDQFHILLIGDPGTGKTDILRAAESLAPVSSFGLGSGTTNTGLTVTVTGSEISKGILSLADGGLALIDELNLMKKDDRAGLYNAMEKGFITYDKGGHHYRFDARCSLLASANPIKGKFAGKTKEAIEKQIPFDSALLSRFHLIYLIREASIQQFMEIADQVFSGKKEAMGQADRDFITRYIARSRTVDVDFRKDYHDMIKKFVAEMKEREKDILIDITPRFIIGLKRLIEASARMELRTKVEQADVLRAMEVFAFSLEGMTFSPP